MTVGDGDTTAAPLAGARAQPKLHAASLSGTAMAPFAGHVHAREEAHGSGGGSWCADGELSDEPIDAVLGEH